MSAATTTDLADKWLSGARAQAALRGVELHIHPDGEYELRRGPYVQRTVGRGELVTALRLLGCTVPDAPMEDDL